MLLKTTLQVENFHIRNEVLKRMKDIIYQRTGTPEMKPMLNILKVLAFET
jgi:Ubiquitin carboxyl-terminal hydrolase